MDWQPLMPPAQVIGGFATALAAAFAAAALWVGVRQILAGAKTSREAGALQAHRDYLQLCFDNPTFSSTEQFLLNHPEELLADLITERTIPKVRYLWFLSCMLGSLEQIMEYVSNEGGWRRLAVNQIRYHHPAIAEVWKEWKGHYGPTLDRIVEEALRAGPATMRAGVPSERLAQSGTASRLLKRLKSSRAKNSPAKAKKAGVEGWGIWLSRPYMIASIALSVGLLGGVLFALIALGGSGSEVVSSNQAQVGEPPIAQSAPTVECVPCTRPNEGWQLLPWLEFAFAGLIIVLIAWWLLRSVRTRNLTDKAAVISPAVPGLGMTWNWIKPQLAVELSDGLHNLLAMGLLGLFFLASLVVIVGFPAPRKWRRLRLVGVILLGLLPILPFAIPTLRTDFAVAIMSDGRIEAFYVGALLAGGYLAGVGLACIGALRRLWNSKSP